MMDSKKKDNLRNLVNASGFVFQLAVERAVQDTPGHDWKVYASEHPWYDSDRNEDRFIDLVLKTGGTRIVIECKRRRTAEWVFLVPSFQEADVKRMSWRWVDLEKPVLSDWADVLFAPSSHEAKYCAVRGSGETDNPMLERIGASLLRSLDALADQELSRVKPSMDGPGVRTYVAMIVTTAKLFVFPTDDAELDLSTGTALDGASTEVDFVRFRKSFAAPPNKGDAVRDLGELAQTMQRTVIVANAAGFPELLKSIEPVYVDGEIPPWKVARGPMTGTFRSRVKKLSTE